LSKGTPTGNALGRGRVDAVLAFPIEELRPTGGSRGERVGERACRRSESFAMLDRVKTKARSGRLA
jgi:hypothetical protein